MEPHKQLFDTSVSQQSKSFVLSTRQISILKYAICYIAGGVMTLLSFRFLLTLISADTSNIFANVVYSISNTAVWPFSLIFQPFVSGQWYVDIAAIAAILFYGSIAWGVSKSARVYQSAVAQD